MPLLLRFKSRSGKNIKITEQIAGKNEELCSKLLEDNNRAIFHAIRENEYEDERITEAIFQRWLKGVGKKPVSWTTLVATLRKIPSVSSLVRDIEEHFSKSIIIILATVHYNKYVPLTDPGAVQAGGPIGDAGLV